MTDGAGADDRRLVRHRADRGIALVFVLTGVLGVMLTVYALNSRYYRQLEQSVRPEPETRGLWPRPSDRGGRLRRGPVTPRE